MPNSPASILLIDDTLENLQLLASLLEIEGHRIKRTTSGMMALQYAQLEPPDLILLDINMPKMSGFEVCKEFKSSGITADIPVIFITALDQMENKIKAFELGAIDYIIKPFQEKEVLLRVKTQLTIQAQKRQLLAKNQALEEEIKKRKEAEIEIVNLNNQLKYQALALEKLATTDFLTQIANRRGFEQLMQKQWEQLSLNCMPLFLILCDIDYFKQYNDHYGHLAGDEVLILVAEVIRSQVELFTDLVARYGGEEFGIVISGINQEQIIELIENIRQKIYLINITHKSSSVSDRLTLSFGLASIIPSPEATPQCLINRADKALYQAKVNGRNCYSIYQVSHSSVIKQN